MNKIILSEKGGFCFGVKRALDKALELTKENVEITTYGDIIHNPLVVNMLKEKGVGSVENLDDLNTTHLIIRSHGVSPNVYDECKNRDITIVDATCPFVKKIQDKAKQCKDNNVTLIIAGEANHPEIVGINGWYGDAAIIINSIEEANAVEEMEKACVVAQTTTSVERFDGILEVLKTKVKDLEIFNSICSATRERQMEALEISKNVI